jgi:2-haloalkanoic acid dehalogenase type II
MKPIFSSSDKKVIFFDLYDTLIDRNLSFARALNESLEEFTARWDNQEWNPAIAVEAYQKEWSKKTVSSKRDGAYVKKRRLVQTRRQLICLSKSLQDSPFEVTDAFLRILLKRTKELYKDHISLYPDVQHTLEHLNEQYILALISNGKRERLIQSLQHAGLAHIFPIHTIFVPSSPRTKKPHPEIFHKALKTMEIEPHQAIMVGNSWTNDIFGGNRCGMDTVWIQSRNQKMHIKRIGRNKVITIARFKQLLSLFNINYH